MFFEKKKKQTKFYCENYFNLVKIFVLRLFKMASNCAESSRLEHRSVIKFLVAKNCKSCDIYRRMCGLSGEAYFCQKMFPNGLNIGLPLRG